MMENWPSDSKQVAGADDIVQECRGIPTFIDLLPIELLERVIRLGATDFPDRGPSLRWVCIWRRVSRKWASTTDGCPFLWSYINTSKHRIKTLGYQLARSGTVPLDVDVADSSAPPIPKQQLEMLQILACNAHRWRSLTFDWHFRDVIATLDSSPPILEILEIRQFTITPDCKLFSPGSTHLRKLSLTSVTLSQNFEPPFELEELYLCNIEEPEESGDHVWISIRSLHRFLQASPGLQSLTLDGEYNESPGDLNKLPPVDLPKLQDIHITSTSGSSIIHLFKAERCAQARFRLDLGAEMSSLMAWTPLVHALKRAEELEIVVRDRYLEIWSKFNTVELALKFIGREYNATMHSVYSILEHLLNEAERDSPLSARIELALLAAYKRDSDFNVNLEVFKLLQTPISEPSSGLTRWRLPHLDTLRIPDDGRPDQPLQAFVQARSNRGDSRQAPRAVTIIRIK